MLTGLKYQLELFWLSLGFFSRLPIPSDTPYSEQRMNQAGRYFALVGLLLGCLCALVYWVASTLFSTEVAVFLMMCFSLMLTGAFHEDGLTDMADGIGGGMTVERRLAIMKDSRIGTYGASALVMALLGKFVFLSQLAQSTDLVVVIIAVYAFSRGVAASLIYGMPYVSDIDTSKSKPLANKQSQLELTILIVTSLLPLIFFDTGLMVALVAAGLIFRFALKSWLLKRLGGFTGDCLGAAQQLTELLSYLVILAWFGV